jgi:hypothetical protein
VGSKTFSSDQHSWISLVAIGNREEQHIPTIRKKECQRLVVRMDLVVSQRKRGSVSVFVWLA